MDEKCIESCYLSSTVSVGQTLKILTESMKKMNSPYSDIAIMQKNFLEQFGINVSDVFLGNADLKVTQTVNSDDVSKILKFLNETTEKHVCINMIWSEALLKKEKITRMESLRIAEVIDNFACEWERHRSSDHKVRFKKYGKQKAWDFCGGET